MADATHDPTRSPAPTGWRDAFASLPLEAPTTSRWAAIDAALDGTPGDGNSAHTRTASAWPRRFACAAALAAIALPALLWLRPEADTVPSRTPYATAPSPVAPASVVAAAPAADASASTPSTPPQPSIQPAPERTQPPLPRIAHMPDAERRQPAPAAQAKPWPRARIANAHEDSASMQAAFEPYYAEAARLERVIAATRDPRVGSGPAASLAGALDAELAGIDARLAGPGLDAGQRLALWGERVDLLRASAEFESQLRLLAAEGNALDGALVRVD
ncbi:MAG: hypothetical protein KF800_10935 [Lysobacter sp.]|nr:hypothetical protein [Lysobacter sp.]